MSIKSTKKALAELEQERKEILSGSRIQIGDVLTQALKNNPKVDSIRWTQYTPHFNDGDSCEFGVNEPRILFVEGVMTEFAESQSYDNGYLDESDIASMTDDLTASLGKNEKGWNIHNENHPLISIFQDIAIINDSDLKDLFEAAFGDHAQVTVRLNKNGEAEFTVEEYEHD